MVYQFGDGEAFLGVLGQAAQYKALDFRRGRLAPREVDVVVDHLGKILF